MFIPQLYYVSKLTMEKSILVFIYMYIYMYIYIGTCIYDTSRNSLQISFVLSIMIYCSICERIYYENKPGAKTPK